jgi:hypothetical protein
MAGVLETLLAATPSRTAVTMCVDGALQAEWDRTREELEDAGRADADSGSLALPATTAVVARLDEIRARVVASQVTFLLETVGWTEEIALKAKHPPRENHFLDQVRGFNVDAFHRALIIGSCLSVTGVDGDIATEIPDEVWDRLLGTADRKGSLNVGQVSRLIAAAQRVNEQESAVPPSARSLLDSQDFGASLAQPSPGTSHRGGSKAGSPPGSPKSSATKKGRTKVKSSGS